MLERPAFPVEGQEGVVGADQFVKDAVKVVDDDTKRTIENVLCVPRRTARKHEHLVSPTRGAHDGDGNGGPGTGQRIDVEDLADTPCVDAEPIGVAGAEGGTKLIAQVGSERGRTFDR